nr:MAG TPA: hypothetical protein [Caudoviricetes sp.]
MKYYNRNLILIYEKNRLKKQRQYIPPKQRKAIMQKLEM